MGEGHHMHEQIIEWQNEHKDPFLRVVTKDQAASESDDSDNDSDN